MVAPHGRRDSAAKPNHFAPARKSSNGAAHRWALLFLRRSVFSIPRPIAICVAIPRTILWTVFRVRGFRGPVCFLLAKRGSGFFRFPVCPSPFCFDLLANREGVFRGRKRRSLSLGRRGAGEQENQQHYFLQAPYLRVYRGDFQAGQVGDHALLHSLEGGSAIGDLITEKSHVPSSDEEECAPQEPRTLVNLLAISAGTNPKRGKESAENLRVG